jgi:hypothetical protein
MRPEQRDYRTKLACAAQSRWRTFIVQAVLLATCTVHACAQSVREPVPAVPAALQVAALSRGSGVPDATRRAFDSIAARLEAARADGSVVSVERSVIGLEGETRLCVELRDEAARSALEPDIRRLSAGVELLEIKWSACSG